MKNVARDDQRAKHGSLAQQRLAKLRSPLYSPVALAGLAFVLAGLAFGSLISCARGASGLSSRLNLKATSLDNEMKAIRLAIEKMAQGMEAVYASTDQASLDAIPVDVSSGGFMQSFENYRFYHKPERSGLAFYYSTGKAPGPSALRDIRSLSLLEDLMKDASGASDIINIVFYGVAEPENVSVFYPWMDVVSIFPPFADLGVFEWYRRGVESEGPALWSQQPFTDLFSGWVMDVSVPVRFPDGRRSAAVMSVTLEKINFKYVTDSPDCLFLLARDSTLLGMSQAARKATGLSILEKNYMLEKLQQNRFAPEEYRLSDSGQAPEYQELAARVLAGERAFKISLAGSAREIRVAQVPEIGFYLLGFEP